MRPRVFPAEDAYRKANYVTRAQASMRPRVFPAEDYARNCKRRASLAGFNEAAGIPRGRRH